MTKKIESVDSKVFTYFFGLLFCVGLLLSCVIIKSFVNSNPTPTKVLEVIGVTSLAIFVPYSIGKIIISTFQR